MKRLQVALFVMMIAGLVSTSALAAPVFIVEAPGLDTFNIDWFVWNEDPWDIDEIIFDLTTAATPGMEFGGIVDPPSGPDGGSAILQGVAPTQVFGFTFTSFNQGDHFEFGWDPDTTTDAGFGAVNRDLIGTTVTIVASGMEHVGVMEEYFDPDTELDGLRAVIGAGKVPEPSTLALLALGGLGLALRRRS